MEVHVTDQGIQAVAHPTGVMVGVGERWEEDPEGAVAVVHMHDPDGTLHALSISAQVGELEVTMIIPVGDVLRLMAALGRVMREEGDDDGRT